MHIHAGDTHDVPGKSSACVVCLSLPAGATPPALYELSAPVQLVSAILTHRAEAPVTLTVPSSYLSRAPPAL
jgi:hypothetical protein